MRHRLVVLALGSMLFAGCTAEDSADPSPGSPTSGTPTSDAPPTDGEKGKRPPEPVRPFDTDAVLADIRHLSTKIGPREATSKAFRRAVDYVARRFERLGYDVRRTPVRVPEGDSWGVPVDAGTSYNVIAEPAELDTDEPYAIVGAHLDSVAVSPGAEDNASGVATVLELARLASERPPGVPIQFIAFGAEEPRGDTDDLHHFGSTEYVDALPRQQRRDLLAMVSLDRVGVLAPAVPVCRAGPEGAAVQRALLRTARSIGVPAAPCEDRASDHWSFEKAGLPAARIGSVPYAGYHSEADLPGMTDLRELRRVGLLMSRWTSRFRP